MRKDSAIFLSHIRTLNIFQSANNSELKDTMLKQTLLKQMRRDEADTHPFRKSCYEQNWIHCPQNGKGVKRIAATSSCKSWKSFKYSASELCHVKSYHCGIYRTTFLAVSYLCFLLTSFLWTLWIIISSSMANPDNMKRARSEVPLRGSSDPLTFASFFSNSDVTSPHNLIDQVREWIGSVWIAFVHACLPTPERRSLWRQL